ncbi:MAG TPA: hypothetical protein VNW97_20120 [Candidatus Saccharimonadales bacterium]|nr:hypothetical protein [Candidatus Saccharimonadales bacterium]
MRRVKRIGVLSAAKIQGAIAACISLIFVPFVLLAVLFGSFASIAERSPFGAVGAVAGIVLACLIPLFYFVVGFIAGAIQAFVYNLVAGRMGGIEIELDPA